MAFGFIDFVKEVLESSDRPLSVEEMWEAGCKQGFDERLASSGKTPVRTLSASIYVDLKNNPESIFTQVSKRPAKFYLKGKAFTSDPEEIQEPDGSRETGRFHERDLHILLSSFVCADEHFKCMTKTIYHEVSKGEKSGKNRWLHPDIVGVHFPFDSYTDNTLKLFDVLKVNPYKLYSFEMKISLSLSNLRECYFQAVSNSSWVHEGYLAALHISEEPKLVDDNRNFKSFLNDLMEDIKVGKVKSRYDRVYEDEETASSELREKGIIE